MNATTKDVQSSSDASEAAYSEDRQAIAEYYASRTYALTKTRVKRFRRPTERPVWPDRVLSPGTSFGVGLLGLSLVLVGTAALAPILHQGVQLALDPGIYFIAFAMVDQTVVYPVIVGFVFATVTPMFWYGSVLVRCCIAALIVMPGCVASYFTLLSTGDVQGFWVTALAMFCVVGLLPVLIQMVAHWTLSHSRILGEPVNPVGTRSIMELTIVAAIACAILLNVDTTEYKETLLLFTAVAALTSVAVVSMLIALLRVGPRNMLAGGVALLFAFGTSFVYTGMLAFLEYGWASLPKMLGSIVIPALYGTIVMTAIMWAYVWWLRGCGWACISRAEEKEARESESQEPWGYWFGLGKKE